MAVDIILAAVLLGMGGYAALMVWRKIPLLLQVPQQLIEESFITRPSLVKKHLGPVETFLRERRHRELYYAVLVRLLHSLRIALLRFERVVYRTLESLHHRSERLTATEERYWSELKAWKREIPKNGNGIPGAALTEAAPSELTSTDFKEH